MSDILEITSKVYQGLFSDADYHLDMSETFDRIVKESAKAGPRSIDQVALGKARAHGRSCIIAVIGGAESLCNCFEHELRKRTVEELPENWLSKRQRGKKFNDWLLVQKVRFIPILSNEQFESPSAYFEEHDESIVVLRELVKIRNTIAHGGLIITKFKVEFGKDNLHTLSYEFPENFWEKTKFPKDVRDLSFKEAKLTYSTVMSILKRMIKFIDVEISLLYLRDERLEHDGQVYSISRETYTERTPNWCKRLLGE